MTVVSRECENGAVKVTLSGSISLLFTADYLPEWLEDAAWETGRKISSREKEALEFAALCFRVEKAALGLIARAEQSSLRLLAKLEQRFHDTAAVRAVVLRLVDRNLLDDERYAALWSRSRLSQSKPYSPRHLLTSLIKRGIRRDFAEAALKKNLDTETEYALLVKFLEKKGFPENLEGSFLKRQLKHEGFSSEVLDLYFE